MQLYYSSNIKFYSSGQRWNSHGYFHSMVDEFCQNSPLICNVLQWSTILFFELSSNPFHRRPFLWRKQKLKFSNALFIFEACYSNLAPLPTTWSFYFALYSIFRKGKHLSKIELKIWSFNQDQRSSKREGSWRKKAILVVLGRIYLHTELLFYYLLKTMHFQNTHFLKFSF